MLTLTLPGLTLMPGSPPGRPPGVPGPSFLAAMLAGLVAGCGAGELDLDNHRTLEAEDGAFRLRYLSPPWRVNLDGTEDGRDGLVQLVVESPFVSTELPDVEVPGEEFFTYNFVVERRRGNPERLAIQDARQVRQGRGLLLRDVAAFATDAGDAGFDLLAQPLGFPVRRRRSVYLAGPEPGTVFHIRVLALAPLEDDPELEVMLRAVEVAPFEDP